MEAKPLRNFLEIPYDELEEMNLEAKHQRLERVDSGVIEENRRKYLTDEKRIKAVTVCFSDLEGRFHMLDYDKKHLLRCGDHLTFDGSSIKGFAKISESDLKLAIDWAAFYWLPADLSGRVRLSCSERPGRRTGRPTAPTSDPVCDSMPTLFIATMGWCSTPLPRWKGSCSKATTRKPNTSRPAASSSSPAADTSTPCRRIRYVSSWIGLPKLSGPWGCVKRRKIRR